MIVGILLLYIGMKFEFPTLYIVACWAQIIFSMFRFEKGRE